MKGVAISLGVVVGLVLIDHSGVAGCRLKAIETL